MFWANDLDVVVSNLTVRSEPARLEAALVDVFVLGNCHSLVVTQGSSFGPHVHVQREELYSSRHARMRS